MTSHFSWVIMLQGFDQISYGVYMVTKQIKYKYIDFFNISFLFI